VNAKPKAATSDVHAALDALDSNVTSLEDHERRKHLAACKQRRADLSDDELMFESLADLFGWNTDQRGFMHGFVARSLGMAPDEKIFVNEIELGQLLPGDSDVTEDSYKRRVRRAYAEIDAAQRSKGRLALKRKDGQFILEAGKESVTGKRFVSKKKKLICAECFCPLTQGIVEGVDMARRLPGRRRIKFRRAARAVFDSLPECKPLPPAQPTPFVRDAEAGEVGVSSREAFELATVGRSVGPEEGGSQSEKQARPARPIRQFKENAALALRAAKERDAVKGYDSSEEFDRQAASLYVELGRVVAEAQGLDASDTPAVIRQTIARLQAMLGVSGIVATENTTLATKDILDSENETAPNSAFSAPSPSNLPAKCEVGPKKPDNSVQAKGRIPTEFVQRVRDAADLREVVETRGVKLKRYGSEWKGRCPFHEEKTASFSVNQVKGTYYCFGCQKGGNAFNFVMESEGVGFRDAVMIVAGSVGMSLPGVDVDRPPPRKAELVVEYDAGEPVGPEWGDVPLQEYDL
jgi:CHC2 zinc finger